MKKFETSIRLEEIINKKLTLLRALSSSTGSSAAREIDERQMTIIT